MGQETVRKQHRHNLNGNSRTSITRTRNIRTTFPFPLKKFNWNSNSPLSRTVFRFPSEFELGEFYQTRIRSLFLGGKRRLGVRLRPDSYPVAICVFGVREDWGLGWGQTRTQSLQYLCVLGVREDWGLGWGQTHTQSLLMCFCGERRLVVRVEARAGSHWKWWRKNCVGIYFSFVTFNETLRAPQPNPQWRGEVVSHVAMVAKFLDDNKPIKSLKSLFALFQTSPILFNFI